MLREPQHERTILNDFKSSPFVLSHVEELREGFSAAARALSGTLSAHRPAGQKFFALIEEHEGSG
jgi:hypothetical protein